MKTLTFTYAKKDGTKSQRVLMGYTEPSKFYEGTDVSELSHIAQSDYAIKADELYTTYLYAMVALKNEFDINNSYRRFDPSGMSDVVVEHI